MTEEDTRSNLRQILSHLYERDASYEEIQFTNGDGFIEHHIKRIQKDSGEEWDEKIAAAHVYTLLKEIRKVEALNYCPQCETSGHWYLKEECKICGTHLIPTPFFSAPLPKN